MVAAARADGRDVVSAAQFAFDEATVREWLAHDQANIDAGGDYDVDIPENWEPRLVDSEDSTIYDLVWGAGQRDIITGPGRIEYLYCDDSDGGMYLFTVTLEDGALRLAGMYEEARKVGAPDVVGVDAAIAVLEEAVQVGNELLSRLAEYVANHA